MKTYEIIRGKKDTIIYYESKDDKGTPEYYKEGETEIRYGYTEKK
jgi:hypothetical protein